MLPASTSAWSYLETSTYHRSCSTGSEIGEHEVCTPFHHDTEAIGGLARCAVRATSSHRADVRKYEAETLTRRCCHSLVAVLSSKLDPHSHLGTLSLSDRHTEVNNHSTLVE